jgi:hypothetical protein
MDKNQASSIVFEFMKLKLITSLALDFSITVDKSSLIDDQKTLVENFLKSLSPMQRKQFDSIVEEVMEKKGEEFAEAMSKNDK